MKISRRKLTALFILIFLCSVTGFAQTVDSVQGDPIGAKIYTLSNGLKIYISVNKEQPRIQCYIAVRSGSKNDPHETTGLAHYFEHLMFKGTESFGTSNYAAEKSELDKIENLFEVYRKTTDVVERKNIYHAIDSISHVAARYNIPNEYDKLMAGIGAQNSNAYTSYDQTVYEEDIPSNELERWLLIQSERFQHNVIRGFHTELEAVYEEKNISMAHDNAKIIDNAFSLLFPHHPYGTQTVIGTQQELKNPSITNIKNFYHIWYVPNNTAICLSGDLDPNKTVKAIEKYFGNWQPNPALPKLSFEKEKPITSPQTITVLGHEDNNVTLAWRLPGYAEDDYCKAIILSRLLYNGSTGLCDLELNQQQRVLGSYAFLYGLQDYSALMLVGQPKRGQKLERVKQLLIEEVKRLAEGKFEEKSLRSIITNLKLEKIKNDESNEGRASEFVDAFIYGLPWNAAVNRLKKMENLGKADLIDYARRILNDRNYVCIYKNRGIDTNEKKMAKPEITPILANRDTASEFLKRVLAMNVKPIEPVYINYYKDILHLTTRRGVEMLYKQNTDNELFSLTYLFETGSNNNRLLQPAIDYLQYLGTKDMTAEQIDKEFYDMGCQYKIWAEPKRTYIKLSGLNDNMADAVKLLDKLLREAVVNPDAYDNLINDIEKEREDAKLDQRTNARKLRAYAEYGPHSPETNIMSGNELRATNPQMLVDLLHNQCDQIHRILYYGPLDTKEIKRLIDREHQTPRYFVPIENKDTFRRQLTNENQVLIAPYEAKNILMAQYSNRNESFNIDIEPERMVFNAYFGEGMNTIVFQEMRETRALAYNASATMMKPQFEYLPYIMSTFVATQNDKMMDAATTFNDILNNMPESQAAFDLAKQSVLTDLRTTRITKENVLWDYIHLHDLGIVSDPRIQIFDRVKALTFKDLINYQRRYIKGRKYTLFITGDEKDLDVKALEKFGTVHHLTQEEIFGY